MKRTGTNRAGTIILTLAALAALPLCVQPLHAQQGGSAAPAGSPAAVPVPTSATAQGAGAPSQQTPASTQPAGDPTAPATAPASAPAGVMTAAPANNSSSAEMVPVKGELVSKLDTKTAKQGDTVVIKTEEALKTSSGSEIPKGSKLMGHITAVQAHSKESPNSEVVLQFDKAELKSGETMPIHSTIQSIAPPAGSNMQPDAFAGAPSPANGAAGSSVPMSSGRGSTTPSAGVTPTPNPATPNPGTSAGNPSPDGTTDASQSAAGRVVAGSGPNAIRTTDIPGIYLASNDTASVSGALYAAKANVHLDSGTQIAMKVAANPGSATK